jgi:hypothetical protein
VLPAPWLIALAIVVTLLALIPARRLQLAGIAPRWIGLYALGIWLLGMTLVIRPVGARILVPFLIVAYIAPFVAAPDRVQRLLRRGRPPDERPPMKDVTPPDQRSDG